MGSKLEEVEAFYTTLSKTMERKTNEQNKLIIMGDFDNRIGGREEEEEGIK